MITAYLGLNLHATTRTVGVMVGHGTFLGHEPVPTSGSEVIRTSPLPGNWPGRTPEHSF